MERNRKAENGKQRKITKKRNGTGRIEENRTELNIEKLDRTE
jgi:hypothetical protein